MGRSRTDRIEEVRSQVLRKLSDGHHGPGTRFLSNRALATKYEISYQTADRLIRELCKEGHLVRRAASGTYIPGSSTSRNGAYLCFHSRARRSGSFGARLLEELIGRLNREGLPFQVVFDDEPASIPDGWYAVLWEWPHALNVSDGLLLHRRPASGMDSTHWDSVTVDDYSGGVCAAQVLRDRIPKGKKWVVVSGPKQDDRSDSRVAGFASLLSCEVVPAGWFTEDGERVAAQVIEKNACGIFCANDRIAEGLFLQAADMGQALPPLVGFDNAPIAEKLGFTTIAIPWSEMTLAATTIIRHRLTHHWGTGTHQVLAPRPILRW